MKFKEFINEKYSDELLLKLYSYAKDKSEYKTEFEELIKKNFKNYLSPHIQKALNVSKTPESFLKSIKDFESSKKESRIIERFLDFSNNTKMFNYNLIYQPESGTIRNVPENYWVASVVDGELVFDSWDGMVKGKIDEERISTMWKNGEIKIKNKY